MKKSFIIVLFTGLISACTAEYITKDPIDGTPIEIRDRQGIIEDALRIGTDSICIVTNGRSEYYPIRWMNENTTTYWQDTLKDGSVKAGSLEYRVVYLKNIIER
jgi:hypothetical protein